MIFLPLLRLSAAGPSAPNGRTGFERFDPISTGVVDLLWERREGGGVTDAALDDETWWFNSKRADSKKVMGMKEEEEERFPELDEGYLCWPEPKADFHRRKETRS